MLRFIFKSLMYSYYSISHILIPYIVFLSFSFSLLVLMSTSLPSFLPSPSSFILPIPLFYSLLTQFQPFILLAFLFCHASCLPSIYLFIHLSCMFSFLLSYNKHLLHTYCVSDGMSILGILK